MSVQFVNHLGHPLNVEGLMRQESALAQAQTERASKGRTKGKAKKTEARAFEVVGISVKRRDAAARKAAEKLAAWEAKPEEKRAKSKAKPPEPWDEEKWLDEQPLKRAMRETFQVESAAKLAAEMLAKQGGFLRVSVARPGTATKARVA